MNKAELRKTVKEKNSSLTEEYTSHADSIISDRIISSREFINSSVIFIYVSMKNEPSTVKIIEEALRLGKTVCVPKCVTKNEMTAVRISGLNELSDGSFGIPEPDDSDNTIEKRLIDTAIIPCTAASLNGKRLGHGAGYYDRFLENTNIYKICLCYSRLIFDDIPTDEHDIIMDKVITEEAP